MPYSEETTDDLIINLMLNTPYNPETAELNQMYLTPDTTDQDIADAISAHNTSNTAHADIRNAIPTKISDLTDDTATYPIDKADTLTGLTSTIAELNILDGVTATASEINVLDGITASTTELNYVDGVTSSIQTQLNNKLAKKPDGTNDLVDSNNKVNITYLPDVVLGQMLYAGSFVPSTAVATLSTNAKTILGTTSNTITLTNDTSAITGYEANEGNYYIASSDGTFASISFLTGDWLISTGSGWTKVSNTDAVTGVKGNAESTYRTGNVNLTPSDIGAITSSDIPVTDVKVNNSSVVTNKVAYITVPTQASDIGAYPDTNPDGYTSNVGTVTSVNNQQPDANGNVTVSTSVAWGGITGTLSNQTDLNTALNGKVSKSACAEVYPVIETYVSGTSWYRIYSDGWCEQGGRFNANNTTTTATYTVNLLKFYIDTNYSIVTCGYSNHADSYKNGVAPYSFTTSSFVIQTFNNDALQPIVWRACGYLAEGQ